MSSIDLSQLFAVDKLLVDSSFDFWQIFISLSITFLVAMFIYVVYKKTYNGVLYSKNFNLTLVMVALIVDALMIGISGNLVLSLGLVGALSIVRFRTAVKDPKDTAFIFWAISIGVINGVGYYELSVLVTVFIAIVLAVLSRSAAFEPSYMLIVQYASEDVYANIEAVLKKDFLKYFVRSDSQKPQMIERVIEVKMKKDHLEKALSHIRSVDGVQNCTLLSSNGEFSE